MIAKRIMIIPLLIITLIILLIPIGLRALDENNSLIGEASYFHLGVAQNIANPDSYPLPENSANLYHYLLAGLLYLGHPSIISKLLPIILGLFSAGFIFCISRRIGLKNDITALTVLFMSVSPLFIIVYSSLNPFGLLLTLLLLSWYLFTFKPWAAIPPLLLITLIDARGFIVACVGLLAYALLKKQSRTILYTLVAGIIITLFLYFVVGAFAAPTIISGTSISEFFVSFGSEFGLSLFMIILAFVGLVASWSKDNRVLAAVITSIGLIIYSYFEPVVRVILLAPIAIFSAKGITMLFRKEWTVKNIKGFTLFLIILSLLFTATLAISTQVNHEPDINKLGALHFLKTAPQEEFVLSSHDNGIFIERIARQQAFLDNIITNQDLKKDIAAKNIFMAQRVKEVAELLDQHKISHVLIDGDMRNGGVWTHRDQGLLFLLENSDHFVEVYRKGDVEVYRYIP